MPNSDNADSETFYKVPTHSASSFIKTTTTADMIAPMVNSEQGKLADKGPTAEQLIEVDQSLREQPAEIQVPPSRSLI